VLDDVRDSVRGLVATQSQHIAHKIVCVYPSELQDIRQVVFLHHHAQEKRHVRQSVERVLAHFNVDLRTAWHRFPGQIRNGRRQRRTVLVQHQVPVRVPEPTIRVHVQKERQVERRRPVPDGGHVERQCVHRLPVLVVPEHQVVPVEVTVAQHGQWLDRFHQPSHFAVHVAQDLGAELSRLLVAPVPVTFGQLVQVQ